jgi:hypothetical protein
MVALARTSTGLLYRSDGSLAGWSGPSQWSSVSTYRFPASPTTPILPGAIALQMKGEPRLRFSGGYWYLIYNDVVINNTSRPAIQRSADRGLTWTDLGPLTYSSTQTAVGLALGDMFLDPVSGKWVLTVVSETAISYTGGLTGPPATVLVFKSTGDITGPFALQNTIVGNPGSWNDNNPSPGGTYWDGTHYNLFIAGGTTSGTVVCGLYQSTTLNGTFTQPTPSTALFDINRDGPALTSMFAVENTSVAFNQTLNLFVMTCTTAVHNSGNPFDYSNVIQSSATLAFPTTDWKHIQWLNPADVQMIMDAPSFVCDAANSHAAVGPNGEMTLVLSGQRPGTFNPPGAAPAFYVGLIAHYATIEPSSAVIRYAGSADATYRQLNRSLAHTDITIECACELTGINVPNVGGEFHVVYRSDGIASNEYRAVLVTNGTTGTWRLDKLVGGTRSLLTNGSGSEAFGNQGATLGMLHRLKVQVVGNVHQAWLDGELQYTFTDSSSPLTSGTNMAVAAVAINCDVINLSCRTSDTITVTGMQPNTSVWLRAACGIPIAPIVANSSGVGTISYGHFPLYSLEIGGTDYTVGSDSRIWGGDTLQFSGLPASSPVAPPYFNYT